MRIGSDHRVRIRDRLATVSLGRKHYPRQKFQVDLVADSGVGRNDRQVLEGLLSPAQEGVALAVARVLNLSVELERLRRAELIHLHRMVDDEFHRLQRIDPVGIAAQRLHGIAHGRQIDNRGDAREVLQQDAAGHERDFLGRNLGCRIGGQRANHLGRNRLAVLAAQQVFQQDAQRIWQPRHLQALFFKGIQAVNFEFAVSNPQEGATAEGVFHRDRLAEKSNGRKDGVPHHAISPVNITVYDFWRFDESVEIWRRVTKRFDTGIRKTIPFEHRQERCQPEARADRHENSRTWQRWP